VSAALPPPEPVKFAAVVSMVALPVD